LLLKMVLTRPSEVAGPDPDLSCRTLAFWITAAICPERTMKIKNYRKSLSFLSRVLNAAETDLHF